jgi:hypothetical protein
MTGPYIRAFANFLNDRRTPALPGPLPIDQRVLRRYENIAEDGPARHIEAICRCQTSCAWNLVSEACTRAMALQIEVTGRAYLCLQKAYRKKSTEIKGERKHVLLGMKFYPRINENHKAGMVSSSRSQRRGRNKCLPE